MPEGPSRGDVHPVDFSPGAVGSEQQGQRPAVIVSNDIGNAFSPVVIVAAMTTKMPKREQVWDVNLPAGQPLEKAGRVMCNQLFTIDKSRLMKKIGSLSAVQLVDLDRALRYALDLEGIVPGRP